MNKYSYSKSSFREHLSSLRSPITVITAVIIFSFIMLNHSISFAIQQDYLIGAQDKLKIEVWDHPDLTREVSVSLTGLFTFPLIGEIKAAGLTAEQVQKEIARRLADGYLIKPQVTVTITEYRSKQINILGEVRNPGAYPYTRQTSLIEIISIAGGLTKEAGPEAYILRSQETNPLNTDMEGRSQSITDSDSTMKKIDLNDLLQSGQEVYFLLRENDTIYIPRTYFFYVLGEVNKPGQYKLEKETTVLKAVSTAGGHTKKANLNKITIVRVIEGEEKELPARLSDPVLSDDIIKVPERFF
jgi:polysaccharide export outer membrane protein